MFKFSKLFEKYTIFFLMGLMIFVVAVSCVSLVYNIILHIISPPFLLFDINFLLDIFGMFLLVLIGIELLETIKTYLVESYIRLQIVIMVALIAITRKVIILKVETLPPGSIIGIATIIASLTFCYYVLKRK